MSIDTYPQNLGDALHLVCTSSTRPTTAGTGALIFETDTTRLYMNTSVTATPSWKYLGGGTDPCGARAWRNSAFTLTVHATNFTLIPFDSEVWDYGNNFATGTGRYTCAESGQFRVDGRVSVTTTASGERFVGAIFKNASEELRGTDIHSLGAIRVSLQAHGVVSCVAGDVLDFRVQQTAGTARGIDVGQSFHSVFEVSRA